MDMQGVEGTWKGLAGVLVAEVYGVLVAEV
jgi:hypothetical protein